MNEPTTSTSFGRAIRIKRKARGMTQANVADAIGVERSYLSRVERGKGPPFNPSRIDQLAELFGVEEDELHTLAAASRPAYKLSGVGVSEAHRALGAALESAWPALEPERLRALLVLVEDARAVDPVAEQTEFGRFIQDERIKREWSQQRVATAINVARSYISMVETGQEPAFPEVATRRLLARLFRVPLATLTELAQRAKAYYRLDGLGDEITDAHRSLGSALEERWRTLPPEALAALLGRAV